MIRVLTLPEIRDVMVATHESVTREPEALDDYTVALGWGDPIRGAFFFKPESDTEVEAHVAVLKGARGREAIANGHVALNIMRRNGRSIVARIPQEMRASIMYALLTGMRVESRGPTVVLRY